MTIDIRSKQFSDQGLWVNADVIHASGNRCGGMLLDLPEGASDDEIKAAIAAAYGLTDQ